MARTDEAPSRPEESPGAGSGSPAPSSARRGAMVGVDGSEGSQHALAWATRRVDRFGLIRPVFAWQYPAWAMYGPFADPGHTLSYEQFEAAAKRQAADTVSELPDDVREPVAIVHGPAGPALAELSATANVLVVGTRGHGAVADNVLGSVGAHVSRSCSVPVIVVPESAPLDPTHNRVLVGIDGSANSVQALIWAMKNAPDNAEIEAVYVWSHLVHLVPAPYVVPIENSEEAAQATLDEVMAAARAAAGTEREVAPTLAYGDDVRNVLLERSEEVDMLVLGARGRAGIAHLLLGSVTTSLLHQPRTVTVVVPAG